MKTTRKGLTISHRKLQQETHPGQAAQPGPIYQGPISDESLDYVDERNIIFQMN